jgi:short chain dehydrogenase
MPPRAPVCFDRSRSYSDWNVVVNTEFRSKHLGSGSKEVGDSRQGEVMQMEFSMKKVVLVTGGSRGIGRETAGGLAKLGYTVVIVGRDASRGDSAARELAHSTGNPNVSFVSSDLSSLDEVRCLAAWVADRFGGLSVLVNNAAVASPKRPRSVVRRSMG